MEIKFTPMMKKPFPVSVEHKRHGDTREAFWSVAALFLVAAIFIFCVSLTTGEASESAPKIAGSLLATAITMVLGYEAYRRATDVRWLRSTIGIEEAEIVAKFVNSTSNWSFMQELPSVPASFPDISNGQLQAWCRECNSILKAQRIIELRRCVSGATAAVVG